MSRSMLKFAGGPLSTSRRNPLSVNGLRAEASVNSCVTPQWLPTPAAVSEATWRLLRSCLRPQAAIAAARLTPQWLEWLRATEDLAVEDGVPGIGVCGPATPSLRDLAQLLLCREPFGDGLARDRGIGHAIGPQPTARPARRGQRRRHGDRGALEPVHNSL
jgi:hypothetical protein